jgi:hypothetical protein
MREIKFRAWHVTQKRMFSAEEMGKDQLTLSVDGRGFVNVSGASTKLSTFYGENMIPMQYTGLKDENGKEIFEGDILNHDGVRFDAAWDNVLGSWMCWPIQAEGPRHLHELAELSRIVGNIYENPEMIGHITIEGRINL